MKRLLLSAAICLFVTLVSGQVLMSGGIYSQHFDSLATGGTPTWTNNLTVQGWYASKSAIPNDVTNYDVSTGSGTTGALYSFGSMVSTDRALGSLASGTQGDLAYGVRFVNDTFDAQTNFTISYTGEQWRVASTNVQKLTFAYRTGTTLTDVDAPDNLTWTTFPVLDFASPTTNAISGPLDGNNPTNRQTFINIPLPGVVIQPGEEIFFRWFDSNDTGSDDGLAVDDLTIAFSSTPASTNNPPPVGTNLLTCLIYNVKGNGATDWSTNAAQVQAIGRELIFLNPDIIAFNEIPYTNTYQMADWVKAFLPGYFLATNSGTDGFIRSVIVSRYPIARSQSWMAHTNLSFFGYNGNFARDLFEAQINVPWFPQPLHVFAAQLKATTGANATERQDDADHRAAEASAVSNFFANVFLTGTNKLHPYILCGDMNEDIARPGSYVSGQPIQRLVSATTGLRLTTPTNLYDLTVSNDMTISIQATHLSARFDYIMPCSLLFSNIAGSQVFRMDKLVPLPPQLNADDDKTASDHLPVLMVFNDPYGKPFSIVSVTRTNPGISLDWQSVPRQPYRVEVSSDLFNWSPFVTNLMATDYNLTFTTNSVPSDMKFFRIYRGW